MPKPEPTWEQTLGAAEAKKDAHEAVAIQPESNINSIRIAMKRISLQQVIKNV